MSENRDDDNIRRFPDAGERAEIERVKAEQARLDQLAAQMRAARGGEGPVINLPPATKGLVFAMLALYALQAWVPPFSSVDFLLRFAFIPARYADGLSWEWLFTPLTSMFLHASWLHVGINALTLAAFGAGLEKYLGARRLVILFLATGYIAAFAHLAAAAGSNLPLVGGSGGVSGLFAAALLMMQERSGHGTGLRRLLPVILVWIGISVFFGVFGMPGAGGDIAWAVHIGGFFAGLALYRPVSNR